MRVRGRIMRVEGGMQRQDEIDGIILPVVRPLDYSKSGVVVIDILGSAR
jgi:hypothetical protein